MEGAGCQLRVRNRAGEGREGMVAIGRAQKTLDVQGGRNSFFYTQKTICEPYLWNKLSSLPLVGEKTRTPACAPQLMSPVAGCRLTFQFLYRPQCQQQQHQDPWGRKTDEKERRVEFQFQPMSTWSLPPGGGWFCLQPMAFQQDPGGPYTGYRTKTQPVPSISLDSLRSQSRISTAFMEPQRLQVRGQSPH